MKHIALNCAALETMQQLHRELKTLLNFPSYYGENFDALYDCLTEIGQPVCLEVHGLAHGKLCDAEKVFRRVLLDADANNPYFAVVFL